MDSESEINRDRALGEVKVLTADTQIMGLPAKLFLLSCILTIGIPIILMGGASNLFLTLLLMFLGALPGLSVFFILFLIHQNDPAGFDAWVWRAQSRFKGWKAGEKKPRNIKLN